MSFVMLKAEIQRLRDSLVATMGRSYIDEITIVEPSDSGTELDFVNLVSWLYIFLFEASPALLRQLEALARQNDPTRTNRVLSVRQDVNHLRTYRCHNLPPTSKSNDDKRRKAEIWLQANGGNPTDWGNCFEKLLDEMAEYLKLLSQHWFNAISTEEDKAQLVSQLAAKLERRWAAHEYDRIVEEIAIELRLDTLDISAYREHNLNEWQKTTSFFTDKAAATNAIRIFIRNQLIENFIAR